MSSKFFATGDSSESEDEVPDKEQQKTPEVTPAPSRTTEDSDDEEDQQRVVRSEKDKRFDQLKSIIKALQNAMKISDWASILNQFDKLSVEFGKANKVVRKEGIPKFYLKCVLDLDNFFKETTKNKEALKKLNRANQKAFAAMKQKLLKHNKEYEKEIANYIQNPLESDAEEEEEKAPEKPKPSVQEKKSKEAEEEDDDEWKEDESDSDSDIDLNDPRLFDRKFWEKKPKDYAKEERMKKIQDKGPEDGPDEKEREKERRVKVDEERKRIAEEKRLAKQAAAQQGAKKM